MFSSLVERYSESNRHYHNLRHIAELLRLIGSVKDEAQSYDAVCFAAWFHDCVYDTRKNDNEERSAEFAARALNELSVPSDIKNDVQELILATKKHALENFSPHAALFLDADLSILGAPEKIYSQYGEAIRKEYSWVPSFFYRRERKKVLESFITRERIYFTAEMRKRFEEQARHNLRNEIESL